MPKGVEVEDIDPLEDGADITKALAFTKGLLKDAKLGVLQRNAEMDPEKFMLEEDPETPMPPLKMSDEKRINLGRITKRAAQELLQERGEA